MCNEMFQGTDGGQVLVFFGVFFFVFFGVVWQTGRAPNNPLGLRIKQKAEGKNKKKKIEKGKPECPFLVPQGGGSPWAHPRKSHQTLLLKNYSKGEVGKNSKNQGS